MDGIPEREGENRKAGKHSTIGAPVVTLRGGWERRGSGEGARSPPPRAHASTTNSGRGTATPLNKEHGEGGEHGGHLSQEHSAKAFDLMDSTMTGQITEAAMEYELQRHPYLAERLGLTKERSFRRAIARLLQLSGSSSLISRNAFISWCSRPSDDETAAAKAPPTSSTISISSTISTPPPLPSAPSPTRTAYVNDTSSPSYLEDGFQKRGVMDASKDSKSPLPHTPPGSPPRVRSTPSCDFLPPILSPSPPQLQWSYTTEEERVAKMAAAMVAAEDVQRGVSAERRGEGGDGASPPLTPRRGLKPGTQRSHLLCARSVELLCPKP
jgi:hypothetical protein